MRDGFVQSVSIIAAVGIVGGGFYLLLDKAAPIVAVHPERPKQTAAPSSKPPAFDPQSVPAEERSGSAIYRCNQGGSVVYSDTPCQGGRVVDVQVTQGFEPQRASPVSARSQAVEPATPRTPAIAQANGSAEEVLCAQIDRAIEAIDAAARRGGTIQYMEDLNERRRKLVEKRQEYRC